MAANENSIILPPLRKNITIVFSDYNSDGKPEWMIHDAGRSKFFIIGWSEYEILERWQLANPETIIHSINTQTTLHVDIKDIERLLQFLDQNFLIELSSEKIQKNADEQKIFKDDNVFQWLISHYLFFRIPLAHPDTFLSKTKFISDIVFSRYLAYIMISLAAIGIYQLSTQWEQFIHSFSSILNWQGLLLYFLAFTVIKLFHELGHAYMCKRFGIPVPNLGVAFLVFWPVLYTDTTLSWSLRSEQRMKIALAGIWVETYVTIIALLLWCNTHNLTLQAVCYVTIAVNWLGSVFINVSPFMRFDGYYVLSDFMRMPNLQNRAFALTRWQLRKWLFGWTDSPPERFTEKMHYFLIAYSIFTWIYRLILYFGIALLVYHLFIKVVGIILFGIELIYFICAPIYREIKTWIYYKDKFSFNLNTQCTIAAFIFLILVLFIPFNNSISLPATLSFTHQFLYSPIEGTLESDIPPAGTAIKAKTPIITIRSDNLDEALKLNELNYQQKLSQLRRTSILQRYSHDRTIILSDLNKQTAQKQKLIELKDKLKITVPFDGVLIDVPRNITKNSIIMKDEWLGDVINPNQIKIEAFMPQVNSKDLAVGQTGYFYPQDPGKSPIPVKVSSIEILNARQLNCDFSTRLKQNKANDIVIETPCYNASDLGGDIPTFLSAEGKYIPVDSVYRVLLTTHQKMDKYQIERGTVTVEISKRQSLVYKFIYDLKSAWIEQTGF